MNRHSVSIDCEIERGEEMITFTATGYFDGESYLEDWDTAPRDLQLTDSECDSIVDRLYEKEHEG